MAKQAKEENQSVDNVTELENMLKCAMSDEGMSDELAIKYASDNPTPASPILLPTPEALAGIIEITGAGGSGTNKLTGNSAIAPEQIMKHYDKESYGAFQKALQHREDPIGGSASSVVGHGKDIVAINPATRDNPNRLYYQVDPKDGRHHAVRERGDLFLQAVFDDHQPNEKKLNLYKRVDELASKCGFDQKPWVYVSQQLNYAWTFLTVEDSSVQNYLEAYPHDQNEWNEAIDLSNQSIVLQILRKCTDEMTVKHLMTGARLHKCSVLACVRATMKVLCDRANCCTEKCSKCAAPYQITQGHVCRKRNGED